MGLDNPVHILILLLVVLLVFGARRLPEIGRSLGTGMRDFKTSLTGESARLDAPPVPGPHGQAAEEVETSTRRY
jgi:sec-independent protein translocase protein TatA